MYWMVEVKTGKGWEIVFNTAHDAFPKSQANRRTALSILDGSSREYEEVRLTCSTEKPSWYGK